MKFNPILAFIALAFAGLVFYGFFVSQTSLLLSLFASISFALYMISVFAVSYNDASRNTVLLKSSSAVLALLMLFINVLFAVFKASIPIIVIENSVSILVWLALLYAFGQKKL